MQLPSRCKALLSTTNALRRCRRRLLHVERAATVVLSNITMAHIGSSFRVGPARNDSALYPLSRSHKASALLLTSSIFGAPPYKSRFMIRSLAFYCMHAGMVLSPSEGVLTLSCTVLKNGRNESVARTCYGLKHDWSTSGG